MRAIFGPTCFHTASFPLGRCGYTDLIPKLWVEKINAVIPESTNGIGAGFHVRWHGLWMEVADGVSMENFLHKGGRGKGSPLKVKKCLPEDGRLGLGPIPELRIGIGSALSAQPPFTHP